jgi:hypothetical protein
MLFFIILGRHLFVVTLRGILVRIDVAGALADDHRLGLAACSSLDVSPGQLPEYLQGKCLRPVVSLCNYLRELGSSRGVSGRRRLDAMLPAWLTVLRAAPQDSRSRFTHVALVPTSHFADPSAEAVANRRDR